MKLSNKVLLAFFGFIFLYITAAFTELRLTGTPNVIDDDNSIAETVDLSGVAYVIINDLDQYIRVIASDRPRLEVRSFSGDLLQKLAYEVSGDTLVLSGFQSQGTRRVGISVFVSDTALKGVSVNHSAASIDGFQLDRLHLSQNSGRTAMSDNRIAKVHMELTNRSFLNISDTKLDTLSAMLDQSEVHLLSPVGLLQGSIRNDAYLQLNEIREIQLKKDESSRMHLYP